VICQFLKRHIQALCGASGSENGMIQLWDAQTGKPRWNVRAHAEYVNALVFSNRGAKSASEPRNYPLVATMSVAGATSWPV
jgi:WD40 repeat protein